MGGVAGNQAEGSESENSKSQEAFGAFLQKPDVGPDVGPEHVAGLGDVLQTGNTSGFTGEELFKHCEVTDPFPVRVLSSSVGLDSCLEGSVFLSGRVFERRFSLWLCFLKTWSDLLTAEAADGRAATTPGSGFNHAKPTPGRIEVNEAFISN